jgi:mannose-6-phosphate isomerase-like protein (cupin superfamily)
MPKKEHLMELSHAGGVQHADDDYWYRPLVAGDNLFTYVAHVLPGGYMAPDAEEAELFELSLYVLEGALLIYYGDETFTIEPHSALFIPLGVPFGVRNEKESVATFVLTFTPPPKIESMEAWLARVPEHKRKSAGEIRVMIGKGGDA